jgi:formate C-acetyltransferase
MLDDKKPPFGEGFLPASIQFMSQVEAGKKVGATPDGREAGAPLCDSLAAIFGKDTKGPTALLNSVTSLNLYRALGVPVLNFNINPDFRNEVLKALILGYMKQGGIQMQITCISREMLEEAYINPEEHKNLVVRVGGYSEYFYRLSDELKRMVIERTIQNEV